MDAKHGHRLSAAVGFLTQAVVGGLAAAFVIVVLRPDLLVAPGAAPAPAPGARPASYADAVARSAPAVVSIYTGLHGSTLSDLYATAPLSPSSLGSGVIVSEDGYILTNDHLVGGDGPIRVALADGRVADARVVGSDPDTDLALLEIDLAPLPVIRFGRSDGLRTGDVVLAIGNPFGIGQTVTQGIVSATGRSRLGLNLFENFIQTDASINPGNSGGALVDTQGRLIGVNTAIFSSGTPLNSEGIGFAIPVNLARGVMAQLIEHGRVLRGWLGVHASRIAPGDGPNLGLENGQRGVLLSAVLPHGPASRAGLRVGDVVLSLDDQPVASPEEALNHVARLAPGSLIRVRASREGVPIEVEARVAERPRGS
jgi:serine peptidase DegS